MADSNNNIEQLVDYKQQKMYPKTLLDAVLYDSASNIVGRNALVKSLIGSEEYNDGNIGDKVYAIKSNAGADITYITKDVIKNLANLSYGNISAGSSKILKIDSDGVFSLQESAEINVNHADEASKVIHRLSIEGSGGTAGTSSTFDGSADVTISKIKEAWSADKTKGTLTIIGGGDAANSNAVFNGSDASIGHIAHAWNSSHAVTADDASTAKYLNIQNCSKGDMLYISNVDSSNNITFTYIRRSNTTDGAYVPMITFNNGSVTGAYESVEGGSLGGSITYDQTESNTQYYLLGATGTGTGQKITAVYGGNGNPYMMGGNLYQTSDATLKTFTEDLDINLDNLSTIKKGLFYWNDDENKILDIGITAQSIEPLFPQVVTEVDGIKSVSYSKLGVIALAAIDKLYKRIQELEDEVKKLKENK